MESNVRLARADTPEDYSYLYGPFSAHCLWSGHVHSLPLKPHEQHFKKKSNPSSSSSSSSSLLPPDSFIRRRGRPCGAPPAIKTNTGASYKDLRPTEARSVWPSQVSKKESATWSPEEPRGRRERSGAKKMGIYLFVCSCWREGMKRAKYLLCRWHVLARCIQI